MCNIYTHIVCMSLSLSLSIIYIYIYIHTYIHIYIHTRPSCSAEPQRASPLTSTLGRRSEGITKRAKGGIRNSNTSTNDNDTATDTNKTANKQTSKTAKHVLRRSSNRNKEQPKRQSELGHSCPCPCPRQLAEQTCMAKWYSWKCVKLLLGRGMGMSITAHNKGEIPYTAVRGHAEHDAAIPAKQIMINKYQINT